MKYLLGIGLPLLVFGLLGFSIWYVPFRLTKLLGLGRNWLLYLLVAGVVAFCFFSLFWLSNSASPGLGLVATIAGLVFFVHAYLFMILLVMDLIRLALPVPAGLTAWLAICLAVGLTAFGAWQANGFVVKEVEVSLPGLEKEVILVHIPDVHIGHHRGRAYLERIVEAANQAKPEMVLINGDLIDNNRAMEPGVLDPLKDLKAPAFLTTGNHEHYVDMDRALKIIAGLGVRILHNEVVQTNGLQLIGLDYMNADENSFDMHAVNRLTIKQELPKIPLAQDKPVVLMHHSPVGLDYVVKAGVDLMVSGHTHAGQVLPATWITPYIFPLNKGLYEQGKTRFFVSQGAGTYGPRLRLGSRNEINVIRLVPQK